MKKVHADVQDSGGNCDQCGESSSSNHLKQHMEIVQRRRLVAHSWKISWEQYGG